MEPEATDENKIEHETRDMDVRVVARLGIALLGMLVLVFIVATAMQFIYTGRGLTMPPPQPILSTPQNVTLPPEPRLMVAPGQDIQTLRADEDAILHSYGYVDQKSGIVRIPIARALDLILQRDLPTRPEDQSKQFKDEGNGQ